jgi:hypothetical protein
LFLYRYGYEIDGSDTDFDLVLPENRQLADFVDFFLTLPIFTDRYPPHIYTDLRQSARAELENNAPAESIRQEELLEGLRDGTIREVGVDINCRHPEEMTTALRREIYALSAKLEPPEAAAAEAIHPCMEPILQDGYTRGGMTVGLTLTLSTEEKDEVRLNVGPAFIREYVLYITGKLAESFPGLTITGGLDSSDTGDADNSTFSQSLYAYERVSLPVWSSVKHTLKRLTEVDIARSYRWTYFKKGWHFQPLEEFRQAGTLKESLLNYEDYLAKVAEVLKSDCTELEAICATAVHIMLPEPSIFKDKPTIWKKVEKFLPTKDDGTPLTTFDIGGDAGGYLAFFAGSGGPMCELRVNRRAAAYLRALLDMMKAGELDFLKTITYNRRH